LAPTSVTNNSPDERKYDPKGPAPLELFMVGLDTVPSPFTLNTLRRLVVSSDTTSWLPSGLNTTRAGWAFGVLREWVEPGI
jgi:hypothetical protein